MSELPADLAFLKDATLDADLKKLLVEKVFEDQNRRRETEAKAAESAATQSLEKKKFWHNTPLVVALVGTITIAANALSALYLKSADATYEASKEERAFAYGVIERELAKSTDTASRAGVLLFLVRAGILNSLNRDELEKMAINDLEKANVDPGKIGIPDTVGLGAPDYSLEVPSPVAGQTEAGQKLLEAATGEINRNVEETAAFDVVQKYWSAVPGFAPESITPELPWSGAFISWVIRESGNPDALPLSAANAELWKNAAAKGITFASSDKEVLPGDIVFTARSVEDAEAIRARSEFKPSTPGIVYSTEGGKLQYIAGNIGNAVRLREIDPADPKIVGFARLGTSGAPASTATGE